MDRRSLFYLPPEHQIACALHLPTTKDGPYPIAILCHGFAGNKSGRYRYQVLLSQALAEKGIASLRFDYRGAGDSYGSMEKFSFSHAIQDLLSVITWCKNENELFDISQMVLIGRSYGGLVVSHSMRLLREKYPLITPRAIVLEAPMFDATPWLEHGRDEIQACQGGGSPSILFRGEKISAQYIQELQCVDTDRAVQAYDEIPLLLIVHEKDRVVTEYHTNLYQECRNRSSASQTDQITVYQADHECSDYSERKRVMELTVQWVEAMVQEGKAERGDITT